MGGGMGGGRGRGGMGGGRGADRQNASPDYYRGKAPPPAQTPSTPHGGEFLQTDTSRYEIVYLPLQARIYLFDHELKPVSARDLHVRMSLKLPPQNTPQQVPFQYVALPAGTAEQDYVVAAFDFRQLPEKDTPITFEFSGLPDRQKFLGIWDRHEGTASFTPMFAPAKIRPYVARVLLTEADRDGVLRQTFCPVSRQMLGIRARSSSSTSPTTPCTWQGKTALRRSVRPRKNTCPTPPRPLPAGERRSACQGMAANLAAGHSASRLTFRPLLVCSTYL